MTTEFTPYPIGTPGQPWTETHKQQWRAAQRKRRSYADDVLSAVDQGTEVKMVSAIRQLRSGDHPPTTVIVSHRTSVLEHADEILVLDGGRVIERGTHDELVARGGVYAETHEHQAGAP